MSSPSSVPQNWREESRKPKPIAPQGRGRGTRLFAILALFLALLGIIGGMLSWIRPVPSPYFLPVSITEYQARQIPFLPMAQRDQDNIQPFFPRANPLSRQEGHVIVQELERLKQLGTNDSAVVYLAAHAIRAGKGEVYILPADASPDNVRSWLPLRVFLENLRECSARNKLLVLDIMKPIPGLRLGAIDHDIAGAIPGELEAVPDPNRLVLCACSSGQQALVSEELGRSVFSYYFEEGLRGYADGYHPGRGDGQITVQDLVSFLQARVDRWAQRNRGVRQSPVLFGTAADFPLLALDHSTPLEHVAVATGKLSYPSWLLDSWKSRDRWWQISAFRLSPRLFQQAQGILMEAERDWRGGYSAERIQQNHLSVFARLQEEYNRRRDLLEIAPTSLAQEASLGHFAGDDARKAVQDLLADIRKASSAAKTDEADKSRAKLVDDFRAKMKDRSNLDIEGAVFALALADTQHDAATLRLLDEVARRPNQALPSFAETLFLRQVADLAFRTEEKEWPAELVGRMLATTKLAEDVLADPWTFPWLASALPGAEQLRHDAEIGLFGRAFVSPLAIEKLVHAASDQVEILRTQGDTVNHAINTVGESMAVFANSVPYLETVPEAEPQWQKSAKLCRELYAALKTPQEKLEPQEFSERLRLLAQMSKDLEDAMEQWKRPFATENVERLIKLSEVPGAGPEIISACDALLRFPTPWLAAGQRAALWQARSQLASKRCLETLQMDRDDEASGQETPASEPFRADQARPPEIQLALLRGRAALELLETGGVSPERLQPLRTALAKASQIPSDDTLADIGAIVRKLWGTDIPAQYRDETDLSRQVQLAWITSPLDTYVSIDRSDMAAAGKLRLRAVTNQLTWLADHYRYLSRDYQGLGLESPGIAAAQAFYAQAASANRNLVHLPPELYATLRIADPLERLGVSHATSQGALEVERFLPPGAYGPLQLTLVSPDPKIFTLQPDAGEIPPAAMSEQSRDLTSHVPFAVQLLPGAERSAGWHPAGFLAAAHFAGRTYHALVPVAMQARGQDVQIILSANPKEPEPVGDLHLRPGKNRQNYYLFVKNLTNRVRKVNVEALAGDSPLGASKVPVTLAPEAAQRISLGEGAAPKADVDLPEFQGPLLLRVTDAEGNSDVLDSKNIRVSIASPREYVRVSDIRFDPPTAMGGNKLAVKLQTLANMPGPPIPVELALPPARIPGLRGVEGGTLQAELPTQPTATPIELFAEKIAFSDGVDDEGTIYLNVDGLERAFVFHVTFARAGDTTTPRGDAKPAIRVNVNPFALASPKFTFNVEVDNAPNGASVEVALGRPGSSGIDVDLLRTFADAKKTHIGLVPNGPAGALIFEAGVNDWSVTLDTSRIFGQRLLRARLIDAQGKEIQQSVAVVTLDGTPPTFTHIVDPPANVKKGTPVNLLAQGQDNESGITQALFFVGRPLDGKIPPNTPTFPASASDPHKTTWSAAVTLPEDKKGPTPISVQLTNGVGLTSFDTAVIELTDVDLATNGPGKIRGKVLEGGRPQPGLEIVLRDEKGKEKARAKSLGDGSYFFDNLPAGTYSLYCIKPTSLRRVTEPAIVAPNQTTVKDLALAL